MGKIGDLKKKKKKGGVHGEQKIVKPSHLAFDVFFQELLIHSVHLDLVAVIVVINHVGAELSGDLNTGAVGGLRVPVALRVIIAP